MHDNNKNMGFMDFYKTSYMEKMYWKVLFNAVKNNKIDTWDYQWVYSVWTRGGVGIIPSRNMIRNIGFGLDATHTTSSNSYKLPAFSLKMPYKPPAKAINDMADSYTKNSVYKINLLNVMKQFLYYETKR